MAIINQLLTFEYEIEYDYAYDLPMKKNYSVPKLYTAGGALNKHWYQSKNYKRSL
jgi:hypothetical protein